MADSEDRLARIEAELGHVRALLERPANRTEWSTVEEAAEHFKVTPQTIRNWCRDFARDALIGEGRVIRVSIERIEAAHLDKAQGRKLRAVK